MTHSCARRGCEACAAEREASDEIDAIRARLATHPDDPDGYEGHDCEPGPAGTLRSTRERDAVADLRALLRALDASQREAERLRGQLTAMHRRAQRAEGIADRYAADRPQGAHGRSVGRALANYAAHRAAQERDEARAEVGRMRAHVERLQHILGERAPDEPVTFAATVGAAMREGIAQARQERDEARAEAEQLRDALEHGLRLARAKLLAEIEAREPGTDADVRVALLLDAVADARRAALEEAIEELSTHGGDRGRGAEYECGYAESLADALDALRALLDASATPPDTST